MTSAASEGDLKRERERDLKKERMKNKNSKKKKEERFNVLEKKRGSICWDFRFFWLIRID